MTWRWLSIRTEGVRYVQHIVLSRSDATTVREAWEPLCGVLEPRDVVNDEGQVRCVQCWRRLLGT